MKAVIIIIVLVVVEAIKIGAVYYLGRGQTYLTGVAALGVGGIALMLVAMTIMSLRTGDLPKTADYFEDPPGDSGQEPDENLPE